MTPGPGRFAGKVVVVTGPGADYITGSVLVVDGGQISLNGVVQQDRRQPCSPTVPRT